MAMGKWERINFVAFILGVAALFAERAQPSQAISLAVHILDFSILALLLWSAFGEIANANYRWNYLRTHWASLLFLAAFTGLFLYTKFLSFFMHNAEGLNAFAIALRNVFLVLKVFGRMRRLFKFFERLSARPAQTVLISFLFVILSGAIGLMLPSSTTDGSGLDVLDALFTATSAVCVTGLIVVDTALALTRTGQTIVMVLIQIGGLGIMLFSFFVMLALRRRLSLQDRLTVSYMLSEDDMLNLSRSVRTIVLSTLSIELAGAIALGSRFLTLGDSLLDAAFKGLFHAISAFCNAGFALYSDSLESFRHDPFITVAIAFLIILGGISFGVINDLKAWALSILKGPRRGAWRLHCISGTNSRVVLALSAFLIFAGFCVFYLLEHRWAMASFDLGEQYLAAFFQSVTLRTAGFNSVSFSGLRDGTLLFMIAFMFIGGASGSTAGGIKVNSLAAMLSYLAAFLRQDKKPKIGSYSVSADKIGRSFLILFFGLSVVFFGTFILSLSEDAPFLSLLFEATSAFGTVGLSTGITPGLSVIGKSLIICLMFIGRLGPLTILTAASSKPRQGQLEYPAGDLAIG
jgi:trk system potassium uptake protein TrkH